MLEGIPWRYGDAGFFACSRADLEPWWDELPPDAPAPAAPPPARRGIWLVLALCPSCRYETRHYCRAHRITGITP